MSFLSLPGAPRRLLASILGDGQFLGTRPRTLTGVFDWMETRVTSKWIGDTVGSVIERYQSALTKIESATLSSNMVSEALPVSVSLSLQCQSQS